MKTFEVGDPSPARPPFSSPPLTEWSDEADNDAVGVGLSHPWKMTGVVEGGVAKIYFRPGMVSNFIPTIGGVSLVAVTPPTLTVTGTSGIVYLDATVDFTGAITALIIANASSIPADTSTQKRKLIGTWTSSGGAFTSVNTVLNTNQTFYLCGGTPIW